MSDIRDNFLRVKERVENAAVRSGADASDVSLICVTKYVEIARIDEAIRAGATAVGENRVQEYMSKQEYFSDKNIFTNIIGQMQSNKVKYVSGKVSLIQSVDRLSLVKEISRLCDERGLCPQDVLVQVNIGREPQKGGVDPDELMRFLEETAAYEGVHVNGLMCIPPEGCDARVHFAMLRRLFEDVKAKAVKDMPNIRMKELSMGMSGDFESAILEGATMVRVGSAIFGAR